jgi:hypothetical protein
MAGGQEGRRAGGQEGRRAGGQEVDMSHTYRGRDGVPAHLVSPRPEADHGPVPGPPVGAGLLTPKAKGRGRDIVLDSEGQIIKQTTHLS